MAFSIILLSFAISFSAKAQDIPNDDSDKPMIDSIEVNENLLDSNAAYKTQFDSLSKDGDWVSVNKSDFVRDVSENTGEDLSANYPQTVEVIYVWRPHCYTPEWNPYSNGQWIFTCDGWIWVSNYSWGWGPYNYGRWYCSNSYGWIWMPGRTWACNWVTWRHHGGYCGWYPTCPRIFWRNDFTSRVYTNHVFAYQPKNWTFVHKQDFTKPVNVATVVDPNGNKAILNGSKKLQTSTYIDPNAPKFKYNGPDVNDISKQTGEKITPKIVEAVNTKGQQKVTDDKVYTYKKEGNPTLSDNGSKSTQTYTKQKKNTEPIDDGYNGTKHNGNGNYNPPSETKGSTNNGSKGNNGSHGSKGNNGTKGSNGPKENPPTKKGGDQPTKKGGGDAPKKEEPKKEEPKKEESKDSNSELKN
ncbi:hypothetical protein BH10BAC5_BH10BAC5_17290 [soil metagenome]